MKKSPKFSFFSTRALYAYIGLFITNLTYAEVTIPVGVVTLTIAPGTGTVPASSVVSLPLIDAPLASGAMTGGLTSFTANTLSNSGAGWTAGALSAATAPYCIRITSGAAKGYTFLIQTAAANTATTVTIDTTESGVVNLTMIGLVVGDTYAIIPCDTISSIFGTPATTGVLGGTTSTTADILQLLVGTTYRKYYYNTTAAEWKRIGFELESSNNVPIRPDTFVVYSRLAATPISLQLVGTVPSIDRKAIVINTGLTTISTYWPVDRTLSQSGIQNLLGWKTALNSTAAASADFVQVLFGTVYRKYYFDGVNWRRIGNDNVSDAVVISAGKGVIINKSGTALGSAALVQNLPYNLN